MSLTKDDLKDLIEKKVDFVARTGLSAVDVAPRYIKLKMPLRGNENHIGTMYAGALFTLAEMPGGALLYVSFNMENFFPIVKEMTIQYKKYAKTDVTIELSLTEAEARRIETETLEKGKTEFVLEADLKDEAGEVVASTRGLYQLRLINKNS